MPKVKGSVKNKDIKKLNSQLVKAIDDGDLAKIKQAIDTGADVNGDASDGWENMLERALHSGKAYSGNMEVVDYLIKLGANVNGRNGFGQPALFIAAVSGPVTDSGSIDTSGCLNRVKYFLEKGADINAIDNDGANVLMIVAAGGNIETFDYLLAKGADINIRDKKDGGTVLFWAAVATRLDMIKYLVEKKKVDVNAKNSSGKTVLDVINTPFSQCQVGFKELKDYLVSAMNKKNKKK